MYKLKKKMKKALSSWKKTTLKNPQHKKKHYSCLIFCTNCMYERNNTIRKRYIKKY